MTGFRPGEKVRITIDATVTEVKHYGHADGNCLKYEYTLPSGDALPDAVIYDAPGVTVEYLSPAIKPGDILTDRYGGIWFAQRYYADFDNTEDWNGCNEAGWRVVLVPLNGGPYAGGSGERPEMAHERVGPFRIVRHEDDGEDGAKPCRCDHHGDHAGCGADCECAS
jgi:hypothetical protein